MSVIKKIAHGKEKLASGNLNSDFKQNILYQVFFSQATQNYLLAC